MRIAYIIVFINSKRGNQMSEAYRQFCQIMTDEINLQAMKHADSLTTIEDVARLPECIKAFELTLRIAELSAK